MTSLHRGLGQRSGVFWGNWALNHSNKLDNGHRTGAAQEAMYRFTLWLVPTVEKFPRSQKFLLGDRL